jgi:hypothetical protein
MRVTTLIAALLAWPGLAHSQTSPESEPTGRVLDGHLFIPSALVRDPFTATYFQTSLGYGYATGTGPSFDVAGNTLGNRDFRFAAVIQSYELQAKILPWWAVRVEAEGLLFSGIDGVSALEAGMTVRLSPAIGTTVSAPVGDRVRIGGVFDFTYTPDININGITGVVRSVNARDLVFKNFLTDTRLTGWQPGVSVAITILPSLGAVATAGYLRISSDTDGVGDSINTVFAGVAFDLDLRQLNGMPIGFVVAYKLNAADTRDPGEATQAVTGGFFYTGVPHLVAGVDFSERWFDLLIGPPGTGFLPFESRSENTNLTLMQMLMRYTW